MRALLLSLVLLAPAAAAAQVVCPYGLVPVDSTHCCWPGQGYAPEKQTCVGAPKCPAGLMAYGDTCIVAPASQQPPPPADPQALPPPPPPPTSNYVPPAPPPPAAIGFAARFEGTPGHQFTVTVDNGEPCDTPCEVPVAPGRHRVRVEGDAKFRQDMDFPAGPSLVRIDMKHGGRAALGIVGLAVGIPAAVIGAAIAGIGTILMTSTSFGTQNTGRDWQIGGIVTAVVGVTFAGVGAGVGFGTAGKNRAWFERRGRAGDEAASIQFLGAGVAPTPGGAVAGATFAF